MSTSTVLDSGRAGRPNYARAFKQQLAEEACKPGVSVSKLARQHQLNANLLFRWRKQFRDGALETQVGLGTNLLPVTVTADSEPTAACSEIKTEIPQASVGHLRLESPRGTLLIEGQPDFLALRLVLEALFE